MIFCLSRYVLLCVYYQNSQSKPNRACQLTNNGTMILIAPRMKPVRSLEKFLEANLCDEYTK